MAYPRRACWRKAERGRAKFEVLLEVLNADEGADLVAARANVRAVEAIVVCIGVSKECGGKKKAAAV